VHATTKARHQGDAVCQQTTRINSRGAPVAGSGWGCRGTINRKDRELKRGVDDADCATLMSMRCSPGAHS
jgi:hypothetical protein